MTGAVASYMQYSGCWVLARMARHSPRRRDKEMRKTDDNFPLLTMTDGLFLRSGGGKRVEDYRRYGHLQRVLYDEILSWKITGGKGSGKCQQRVEIGSPAYTIEQT